ncbi:hypothetical protein A0J61_11227 [Choanephora cucurbitarum]|uniref:Uncharacterized protein n=1 Tax=Choanephora cucurbitarum TaxID=101091 RepID=A0A1C7MV00_9FUNG|nr:hypothetical protein A0J61_11227 [Choanephora cucurbitarum]
MVTASLTEDQAVERQSSVNSFVEGISLSNASLLASSLRFSELQNIFDAQISRMRRSIQTSSRLSRKGKEPVRSFRTDTDCTDDASGDSVWEHSELSSDTSIIESANDNAVIEGEVANDSLTARRKRGNSCKKATKIKKNPKQGSYGSMEQFIFRDNKE